MALSHWLAVPTEYGWLIDWDTTQVPNAYYDLMAGARYPNGTWYRWPLSVVSVSVVNPAPTVVVPANNSTVSGSQWLDCTIPSQLTDQSSSAISRGASLRFSVRPPLSEYGWLYDWNTTSVANGTYSLYCSATYPNSSTGLGPTISVMVAN